MYEKEEDRGPQSARLGPRGERETVDLTLYTLPRRSDEGGRVWGEGEALAARALYYIIGGHFGPPKSLSEHKKYEVLLGPPFFRAASGAAPSDRNGERRCEGESCRGPL